MNTKDIIIFNLKKNENLYKNGCDKYNKSMDEVVLATAKHRKAVVTLKEVCEKQKSKIKEYEKEINQYEVDLTEHEEKIAQLEEDVQIGFDLNTKKREEIEKFHIDFIEFKEKENETKELLSIFKKKKEISDKVILNLQQSNKKLETQVKEKDVELEAISVAVKPLNVSNYQKDLPELISKEVLDEKLAEFEEKLDFHRSREIDLEEEVVLKNNELELLKENLEKYKLKSSSSSIAEELEAVENLSVETKEIEFEKKELHKAHLKAQLEKVKIRLEEQRLNFVSSLYELK